MQLVVVHADLIGHLKALKDYFLLAKGDFFQASFEYNFSGWISELVYFGLIKLHCLIFFLECWYLFDFLF